MSLGCRAIVGVMRTAAVAGNQLVDGVPAARRLNQHGIDDPLPARRGRGGQRRPWHGFLVRGYIPFGSAWYPCLMRRMAERPASLRFFARALIGR